MIELQHLTSNDSLHGMFQVKEGVVYSEKTGQTLTVIYPWASDFAQEKPCLPLVVFVQGSGWTTPNPSSSSRSSASSHGAGTWLRASATAAYLTDVPAPRSSST